MRVASVPRKHSSGSAFKTFLLPPACLCIHKRNFVKQRLSGTSSTGPIQNMARQTKALDIAKEVAAINLDAASLGQRQIPTIYAYTGHFALRTSPASQ